MSPRPSGAPSGQTLRRCAGPTCCTADISGRTRTIGLVVVALLIVTAAVALTQRDSGETKVRANETSTSTAVDETTTTTETSLPATSTMVLSLPTSTSRPAAVDGCSTGRPIVFSRRTQSPEPI